jgi:hypothetical protein
VDLYLDIVKQATNANAIKPSIQSTSVLLPVKDLDSIELSMTDISAHLLRNPISRCEKATTPPTPKQIYKSL